MAEKIYCGSGRSVTTQFGELMKISFSKSDINKMVSYIKENGGDWINLVLKQKRDPQEGKPTHYLEVDTWKPNNESVSDKSYPAPPPSEPPTVGNLSDDLPF